SFSDTQHRAEIPKFVLDFVDFLDGTGNFFAEQRAITLAQAMHETFRSDFRQTERLCEPGAGNIFPLSRETNAQNVKNATAATPFTFIAQSPQRALDHRCCPADIKNPFRRPVLRFFCWNPQPRWSLCHPFVPGNKLHVATAFSRMTLVGSIAQEIL